MSVFRRLGMSLHEASRRPLPPRSSDAGAIDATASLPCCPDADGSLARLLSRGVAIRTARAPGGVNSARVHALTCAFGLPVARVLERIEARVYQLEDRAALGRITPAERCELEHARDVLATAGVDGAPRQPAS